MTDGRGRDDRPARMPRSRAPAARSPARCRAARVSAAPCSGAGRVSGSRRIATTALSPAMAGGHEERKAGPAERGEPADGRADDEPDTVGRAQEPEHPHAVLGADHVGRRRLGHGHAPPRGAVEDPRHHEEPQRAGDPGEEACRRGARQRHDEQGLAPHPVRQSPEQGRTRNCAAEKAARRSPTDAGPAPRRRA